MNKIVLIVDDDSVVRLILTKMIHAVDVNVKCIPFENGETALTYLQNSNHDSYKVIILVDINMPVLDGWGFLDQIQKMNIEKIDQMRFYMVSSSIDTIDELKSQTYSIVKKLFIKPLYKKDIIEILSAD